MKLFKPIAILQKRLNELRVLMDAKSLEYKTLIQENPKNIDRKQAIKAEKLEMNIEHKQLQNAIDILTEKQNE